MTGTIILIVGIVSALVVAVVLFVVGGKTAGGGKEQLLALSAAKTSREKLVQDLEELYGKLVDIPTLRASAGELAEAQDALRAEKGRITITQAELETVENRLRELEEIERELEASGLETKEEMAILEKKRNDAAAKNAQLKAQLTEVTGRIDQLMADVQMGSELQAKMGSLKGELLRTEQRCDELLIGIEQGNEQYFVLKKRYDALDIEYAQLYEKFSEAEALANAGKEK